MNSIDDLIKNISEFNGSKSDFAYLEKNFRNYCMASSTLLIESAINSKTFNNYYKVYSEAKDFLNLSNKFFELDKKLNISLSNKQFAPLLMQLSNDDIETVSKEFEFMDLIMNDKDCVTAVTHLKNKKKITKPYLHNFKLIYDAFNKHHSIVSESMTHILGDILFSLTKLPKGSRFDLAKDLFKDDFTQLYDVTNELNNIFANMRTANYWDMLDLAKSGSNLYTQLSSRKLYWPVLNTFNEQMFSFINDKYFKKSKDKPKMRNLRIASREYLLDLLDPNGVFRDWYAKKLRKLKPGKKQLSYNITFTDVKLLSERDIPYISNFMSGVDLKKVYNKNLLSALKLLYDSPKASIFELRKDKKTFLDTTLVFKNRLISKSDGRLLLKDERVFGSNLFFPGYSIVRLDDDLRPTMVNASFFYGHIHINRAPAVFEFYRESHDQLNCDFFYYPIEENGFIKSILETKVFENKKIEQNIIKSSYYYDVDFSIRPFESEFGVHYRTNPVQVDTSVDIFSRNPFDFLIRLLKSKAYKSAIYKKSF